MKKAILLSLVLLGAAACGGQRKAAQGTPAESATTEAPQAAQADPSPDKEHLSGAYGKFRPLSEADKALFTKATADLDGVAYTPESVATQVVAGTNYRFICTARTLSAEPQSYKAQVVVFKPLPYTHEEPRVTSITRIAAAD